MEKTWLRLIALPQSLSKVQMAMAGEVGVDCGCQGFP